MHLYPFFLILSTSTDTQWYGAGFLENQEAGRQVIICQYGFLIACLASLVAIGPEAGFPAK